METTEIVEDMSGDRTYSVQEAARLLGLKPATLRAWERRHGLPRPQRAANGYRLYSKADIQLLRHLKARTEGGVRIGLAVEGMPPATGRSSEAIEPTALDALRYQLAEAILRMDEHQALAALRESLATHRVETVLDSIMAPVLTWIGDEWRSGHLSAGVEHFASALFLRQLVVLYASSPEPWRSGRALAACLPGDRHEIGLLMLSVGLRRHGWDICYLGADLPLNELERAAAGLRPDLILLSGTCPIEGSTLSEIAALTGKFPKPAPDLVLGGQAFPFGTPPPEGTTILGGQLEEALAAIETLLMRRTHAHADS